MTDQMQEFLTKGATWYPKAVKTINGFQRQMKLCLEEILSNYSDWPSSFTPSSDGSSSKGGSPKNFYSELYGELGGQGEEVILYLGYALGEVCRVKDAAALFYAQIYRRGTVRGVLSTPTTGGVTLLEPSRDKIFVRIPETPNIEKVCGPLLAELAFQLNDLAGETPDK